MASSNPTETSGDRGVNVAQMEVTEFLEIMTVLVGSGREKWYVHKSLLSKTSEYFRDACEGRWKISTERGIPLREVDVGIFAIYVAWLYTGEVKPSINVEPLVSIKHDKSIVRKDGPAMLQRLLSCFAFGDMIMDFAFCNGVIDRTIQAVAETQILLDVKGVDYLWKNFQPDAKIFQLWMDLFVAHSETDSFKKLILLWPKGFVVEFAKRTTMDKTVPLDSCAPQNRPEGFYHEHDT